MGQAIFTINLPKDKMGFFSRVPTWIGTKGKKLSPSARAFAGRVFGVSRSKNPDAALWTSYDQIQEELGVCRATVASTVNALKEFDLIEENARQRNGTSYTFKAATGKRYDIVPLFLYTADVTIGGVERRLTKSQVLLLAHLMTEVKRPKNNGKYEGSVARLARELNLSETTVKKGIKVLLKARLIYRAAEDKGVNGYKLTTYRVNRELFEYERFRRSKKKAKTTSKEKAIADADARAERESYYAQRQQEMKARADRYTLKAYEAAPILKDIAAQLRTLAPKVARAELEKDEAALLILTVKDQKLREERVATLRRFGIEERRMDPTFYARCKKCGDTGFLPNGKGCTCYLERSEE